MFTEKGADLSDGGVALTDRYTYGGDVLMGTLRWEKEEEERAARAKREADLRCRKKELTLAKSEAQVRIQAIQREIEPLRHETEQLNGEGEAFEACLATMHGDIRRQRQGGVNPLDVDGGVPDSAPLLADTGGR